MRQGVSEGADLRLARCRRVPPVVAAPRPMGRNVIVLRTMVSHGRGGHVVGGTLPESVSDDFMCQFLVRNPCRLL